MSPAGVLTARKEPSYSTDMKTPHEYELLDSGDGAKLERFGPRVLVRPSSLCAWTRRADPRQWADADAVLSPGNAWEIRDGRGRKWECVFRGVRLILDLQENGQIGVFPEHSMYLEQLAEDLLAISKHIDRPIEVLNLFAYTGLASCFLAGLATQINIKVTHVDLAQRAIDWAKANAQRNELESGTIRFITDDALTFMAREARRENLYDAVVVDPPSFSRVSKKSSWTLEEKLPEILALVLGVLHPERGALCITNHSSVNTSDVARNIILDHFGDSQVTVTAPMLHLPESGTSRLLPAGSLVRAVYEQGVY
jgi:23S rRNA (cytosine1962-C5)-methyltransferase